MGDSISEGRIQKWAKRMTCVDNCAYFCLEPGEFVKTDELVVQIETDKIVVDINAPESGVINAHCATEGQTVAIGADLFKLDTSAKQGPAAPKPAEAPAAPKPAEAPKPQQQAAPTPAPAPAPKAPSPAPSGPKISTGNRTETRVRYDQSIAISSSLTAVFVELWLQQF
jgi:2-oxoglutarate dehydrogenase E2 component (dihydrolipoamide succinyltransferase)